MNEDPALEPPASQPHEPEGQHQVTPLPPLPWSGEDVAHIPSDTPSPSEEWWYPNVTPPSKTPTIWWLFVLGFIAAIVIEPLAVFLMSAVGTALDRLPVVLPVITMAGLFGPLVVYLVMFLEGKRRLNDRLMSFGKGALFGYLVPFVLLPLLLFGACFFSGFPN
jgi:hypothetical protein